MMSYNHFETMLLITSNAELFISFRTVIFLIVSTSNHHIWLSWKQRWDRCNRATYTQPKMTDRVTSTTLDWLDLNVNIAIGVGSTSQSHRLTGIRTSTGSRFRARLIIFLFIDRLKTGGVRSLIQTSHTAVTQSTETSQQLSRLGTRISCGHWMWRGRQRTAATEAATGLANAGDRSGGLHYGHSVVNGVVRQI